MAPDGAAEGGSMDRNRFGRLTARAGLMLLLSLAVTASGCLHGLSYHMRARGRVSYLLSDPLDKKSPRDHYVSFQGTSRKGGSAFEILPYFIYAGAFEITYQVGLFDPGHVAESTDAIGCLELFEYQNFGDPAHTVDLCGRYTAGGYQVFDSENSDQRFYAGALRLEARISYDGANLSYETRLPGTVSWDAVTSFSYAPLDPLLASLGGTSLYKKGSIGFDDFAITTTMPTDTTFEGAVGWHIQEAFHQEGSALRSLDGASPDFTTAAADLTASRSEIQLGIGASASLDLKLGKQVIRYLGRADRKLERAQQEVSSQDAEGAWKQTQKALRLEGQAFQTLFALDYRQQF
jgi:hypothetical protein